ncbi:MAG: hypothetical protein ABIV50_10550, partial [Opitutus sp.]
MATRSGGGVGTEIETEARSAGAVVTRSDGAGVTRSTGAGMTISGAEEMGAAATVAGLMARSRVIAWARIGGADGAVVMIVARSVVGGRSLKK